MAASQGKHVKAKSRPSRYGKHAAVNGKGSSFAQAFEKKDAAKAAGGMDRAEKGKTSRTSAKAPASAPVPAAATAQAFEIESVRPGKGNALRAAIAVLIVAAVAMIPISLGRIFAEIDAQAFADSTRSAFPTLTDTGAEEPVVSFGMNSDIAADEQDRAESDWQSVPAAVERYTENVVQELQFPILAGGCELVSLDIVLDAMGLDADLNEIVREHLDVDGHFATGYSGDPYDRGGGYPAGVVKAANSYLSAHDAVARAHDISGASFDDLRALVDKGYPVLVWTTMSMADPQFSAAFDDGKEWYNNEHCVVLYGFSGDKALVSDPLDGLVERDAARFQKIFEDCGSMAAVIY